MEENKGNSKKEIIFNKNTRYDFPDNIIRVTAGQGGEALLVLGSEKTALVDCGMAYCANKLLKKIHTVLETEIAKTGKYRSIDYIFATHTHYDHIGAMAAVKAEWPQAQICAGAYATKVFQREGAIQTIQKMSVMASRLYGGASDIQIDVEKMQVDRVLQDGDNISLGREQIRAFSYMIYYLKKSSMGVARTCDRPYSSMSVTVRLPSSILEIEPRQI